MDLEFYFADFGKSISGLLVDDFLHPEKGWSNADLQESHRKAVDEDGEV